VPQRLRDVVAHQQLRHLIQDRAARVAALGQTVDGLRVRVHLPAGDFRQVVAQRRHEAQRAQDAQRIITKRVLVRGPHQLVLKVAMPSPRTM
jgi:hypothetical protein